MDELVDALDEKGQPTGEVISKYKAHENKTFHREVFVIIINSKKEILLQKRAKHKRVHPGFWGTVAGHVGAGESYQHTAIRELEEEVGVKTTVKSLIPMYCEPWIEDYQRAWVQWYLLVLDKDEKDFVLQEDEVEAVRWFALDEFSERVNISHSDSTYHLHKGIYEKLINYIKKVKV